MQQIEFETLTGKKVDNETYRDIIEPAYMASSFYDKVNFAAAWNTPQHTGIIRDLTNQVEGYEKSYKAIAAQRTEMGYFLAEQAEVTSSATLREKAIEILGEKEYITWKINGGHTIWNLDRELILNLIA